MNKVVLTGTIQLTEKKEFDRHDGTKGWVGLFTIRLLKKVYELVELKTYDPEIWDNVKFGDFVYVEGVVKSREYKERWYLELIIYELVVINDTKKKEKTPKRFLQTSMKHRKTTKLQVLGITLNNH